MTRKRAGSSRAVPVRRIVGALAWVVLSAALLAALSHTAPASPVQNDVVYA